MAKYHLQHLHSCKNNCDVFYGRKEELVRLEKYITGPSTKVGLALARELATGLFACLAWRLSVNQSFMCGLVPEVTCAQLLEQKYWQQVLLSFYSSQLYDHFVEMS